MTDAQPKREPRRRRKWLLVLIPLLAILSFAGWREFDRLSAQRAWQEACAEADRLDPGWRWDDLMAARPIPADGRSAAARVHEIYQALPQSPPPRWPDWQATVRPEDVPPPPPPADGPPLDQAALAEDRRREYAESLQKSIEQLAPERQLSSKQVAALRAILAAGTGALARTNGLEDLPRGRLPSQLKSPIMFDPWLSHRYESRTVGALFRFRAILQLQDGRPDEALGDCRRILSAAAVADVEPDALAGMTRFAVRAVAVSTVERVLAQGEPQPHAMTEVQQAAEKELARPVLVEVLRGDRAMFEDFVNYAESGGYSRDDLDRECGGPPRSVTNNQTIDAWLHRLHGKKWSKRRAAAHLRYQTYLVEVAIQSPTELWQRSPEVDAAVARNAAEGVGGLMMDVVKVARYDRQSQAYLLGAIAALAAERFRCEIGRWPDSLAELAPLYLKNVPTDPFDLQPLRYKRLPDGVVIYAVGPDAADDGGAVHTPAPGPLAADIGVRLWDVAHRRQPPKPADDGMKEP